MTTIETVDIRQVDLQPKVKRTDAIQSFVVQETILVTLKCSDGSAGTGYTYTIGTGGSSIVALLHDHLAPLLIGRDPAEYEAIWRDLFFHTHATAVGAITSLALAAIDTALCAPYLKREPPYSACVRECRAGSGIRWSVWAGYTRCTRNSSSGRPAY